MESVQSITKAFPGSASRDFEQFKASITGGREWMDGLDLDALARLTGDERAQAEAMVDRLRTHRDLSAQRPSEVPYRGQAVCGPAPADVAARNPPDSLTGEVARATVRLPESLKVGNGPGV